MTPESPVQPRERHLEWARAVLRRDRAQRRIGRGTDTRLPAAKRPVRQEPQAIGGAVARDTAEEVLIVPEAQLDLDRIYFHDPHRFFDLPHRHVAQANLVDERLAFQ
jgi:hypothetical protein